MLKVKESCCGCRVFLCVFSVYPLCSLRLKGVTGYKLFYRRGRNAFAEVAKILELLCVHCVFFAVFAFKRLNLKSV